ncbi:MAG: polyribonucleotide nucleotidyltransferase [Candidatus Riflemargulisbacteria bacterium]
MMDKKIVKTTLGGVELSVETGRMARQAGGAVLLQYGETVLLATACAKQEAKDDQDFFPLTVDYQEKMYAAGRIPGNFFKREGRPSTEETLITRLTDRTLRPLFPEGFFNDVHVTVTVLSYDEVNNPEGVAVLAASAALLISPIPFNGPVAGVVVGLIDGKYVINPSADKLEKSKLKLSMAGTKEAITMVEAGSDFLTESEMLEALKTGHDAIKVLCAFQEDFVKVAGKDKWDITLKQIDSDFWSVIDKEFTDKMVKAFRVDGKLEKYKAIDDVQAQIGKFAVEKYGQEWVSAHKFDVSNAFSKLESKEFRKMIVNDQLRADGRKLDEIREITCEINVLPRVHGSALFTRGETQSLGTVTLGAGKDEVMVDGLNVMFKKKFFLHYNFPSFSVNEVGGRPGPGRREIGHGALAEKAISYAMPSEESFPYVVRIVSDILESNGSSSMATVCSGCLALMQAGVPLKSPIAGIAMGLIKEDDSYAVLTDIAGLEDHLGDMDFKVAGGTNGITALQMDIKINGVTFEIMTKALDQAKKARLEILEKMYTTIAQSSVELSKYAPRIECISIPEDKVGELIGPGGKNIRRIVEVTGAVVDIQDGGLVKIFSNNGASMEAAKAEVMAIIREPEVGETYHGTIKRVVDFGLFVELFPGKEGLLHVSKVSDEFIKNLASVYSVGDKITVVLEKIDEKGRLNLKRS